MFQPDPNLTEAPEPEDGTRLVELQLDALSIVDKGANQSDFTLILRRAPEAKMTEIDKGKKKPEPAPKAELTTDQIDALELLAKLPGRLQAAIDAATDSGDFGALKTECDGVIKKINRALEDLAGAPAPTEEPAADDAPPMEMSKAKAEDMGGADPMAEVMDMLRSIQTALGDLMAAAAAPAPDPVLEGEAKSEEPPPIDGEPNLTAAIIAELESMSDEEFAAFDDDAIAAIEAELNAATN